MESDFKISTKSLNEFINEDEDFNRSYNKFKSKSKGAKLREAVDFEINPDKVVKIESAGKTTYTVAIKKNVPIGTFENLIIEVNEDDSIETYIATYIPDENGLIVFEGDDFNSFRGTMKTTQINYDPTDLINQRTSFLYVTLLYCDVGGSTHMAGPGCTGVYSVTFAIPISSGGGSGSTNNQGITIVGNGGGGAGGGGSFGGGSGGPTTVPVLDEDAVNIQNAVIAALNVHFTLTRPEELWIKTLNPTRVGLVNNIFKFLGEEQFSDEALEFAKEIIDIIRLNSEIETIEEAIELMIENKEVFYVEIKGPKVDPKEETKCFDLNKPAKVTIYVEQPIPNSREITANIGHTFVGIEQGGISRHLGFYPDAQYSALLFPQDGQMHENSGDPYDVSITIDVSPSQLNSVINFINNYPEVYDLKNYNCSDFGIDIAQKSGLNLPRTIGEYDARIAKFKGRNPADLGQDIRSANLPNGVIRNATGGNAPSKKGDCN